MTLTLWLSLITLCLLGAMSPGPSLAVVVRHTLAQGRRQGILCALSHALGVTLWALMTLWGLALFIRQWPALYQAITYAGALYLAWLGIKALRSKGASTQLLSPEATPIGQAARDGFFIALLNPKLALFFLALFSQFVASGLSLTEQWLMSLVAGVIDGAWYASVALLLSHPRVLTRVQRQSLWIDRVSGVVLLGLAIRVVTL